MKFRAALIVVTLGMAFMAAGPAAAARTETFLETNKEHFAKGETDGLVYTSLGTLRLGRALSSLLDETEGVDYVADLAEAPDGTLYAVTGGGQVYRLRDGNVKLYATLEDKFLFCCVVDPNGVLYVGSGGTKGRVWRLQAQQEGEPKAEVLFEDDQVKYVWDLACMEDGSLAAATGDQGKLLRISADGKAEALIDSEADHVLCLAVADDGTLYAGTDGEALVYRWAGGKAFVLYDAEGAEVTGLALDADGNLYVAVSGAVGGRKGGAEIMTETTIRITVPGGGRAVPASSDNEQPEAENNQADPTDEAEPEPPEEEGDEAEEVRLQPVLPMAATLRDAIESARADVVRRLDRGVGPPARTAVYRITPEGIVTRVFAGRDAMILALAVAEGRLLVGTGREARIYEVALEGDEEEASLCGLDPKQVMALLVTRAGRVVAGTASPGRLYALSKGFAKEGTYTSRVYDAGGSARWGALEWRGRIPEGTEIRLATRTGNVRDPEEGMWSDWSKDRTRSPARIESPTARFIRFRVTMRSRGEDSTPVLEQFEAAYLRPNEPPKVLSITEKATRDQVARAQALERLRQAAKGAPGPSPGTVPRPKPPQPPARHPIRILTWRAEDPNQDQLRFDLYFRGQGEPQWILLEEDLVRPNYFWDTSTVADGWYEIKVVASDRADNPAETAREDSKVSDPILVDNTAPVIGKVETKVGKGEVEVRLTAGDATSRLTAAAYTVDSATDWRTIVPTDGLFDGLREEFRFTIKDLSEGPHRLAIRVTDQAANTGHAAATVEVGE